MGCSGSFGIDSNTMLGLSLFDSFQELENAKVVSMQCGRHSMELRAAVVDCVPEKGQTPPTFVCLLHAECLLQRMWKRVLGTRTFCQTLFRTETKPSSTFIRCFSRSASRPIRTSVLAPSKATSRNGQSKCTICKPCKRKERKRSKPTHALKGAI